MPSFETIKKELKDLTRDIDIAIAKLKELIPGSNEKYNTLILLEGRYQDLLKEVLNGTISDEDKGVESSTIRVGLLTIIQELTEADFQEQTAATKTEESPYRKGNVLYRIPDTMQVNKQTTCTVRIAFNKEILLKELESQSNDVIKDLKRVSETMAVELIDPTNEDTFEISSHSDKVQIVDKDDFTAWNFYVKPLKEGEFPLLLKISVIEMINGQEKKRNIEMIEKVQIVTGVPITDNEEVSFKAAEEEITLATTSFYGAAPAVNYTYTTNNPAPNPSPVPSSTSSKAKKGTIAAALNILIIGMAAAVSGYVGYKLLYDQNNTTDPTEISTPIANENIDKKWNSLKSSFDESKDQIADINNSNTEAMSQQILEIKKLLIERPKNYTEVSTKLNSLSKNIDSIFKEKTDIADSLKNKIDELKESINNSSSKTTIIQNENNTIKKTGEQLSIPVKPSFDQKKYEKLVNKGMKKKEKGKGQEAKEEFVEALDENPNGEKAKTELAILDSYFAEIKKGDSIQNLGNCLLAIVHYDSALVKLENGKEAKKAKKKCSQYNELLQEGNAQLDKKNGIAANKKYKEALEKINNGTAATKKIEELRPYILKINEGDQQLRNGNVQAAKTNYVAALIMLPRGIQAVTSLGKIETHDRHITNGDSQLNTNCESAVRSYESALGVIRQSKIAQQKRDRTRQTCQRINEGFTLLGQSKNTEAQLAFDNALRNNPSSQEAKKGQEIATSPEDWATAIVSGERIFFKAKKMPNGQTWMTEPFKLSTIHSGSWCYENNPTNCKKYGPLYNWSTAQGNICPQGWHLPSDEEWRGLALSLGGYADRITGKEVGNLQQGYDQATRQYGLKLGGFRWGQNIFQELGQKGAFWTSTAYPQEAGHAVYFILDKNAKRISRSYNTTDQAYSCLCVKN